MSISNLSNFKNILKEILKFLVAFLKIYLKCSDFFTIFSYNKIFFLLPLFCPLMPERLAMACY